MMHYRFQDENGEWYNEYDLYGYEGYEEQVTINQIISTLVLACK